MYWLFKFISKLRNYNLTLYYRKRINPSISYLKHPLSIVNYQFLQLGNNFSSKGNLRIDIITYYKHTNQHFKPKLVIGNNVVFNKNVHIGCCGNITIGENCLFASNIYVSDHSHGDLTAKMNLSLPYINQHLCVKDVVIGNNCWIGEYVSILPGVSIGNNCIVGANSVVTKSFPENVIIAGNPARIIKKYNPQTSKWENASIQGNPTVASNS